MSSLGDCIPLFTMEIACTHFHFLQRDMLAFDERRENFLRAFCSEKSIFHYVHSKKVLTSVQEVLFWEYILELQKNLFALL